MTVNLRLSLAVFSIGFAIQAAGDAYALAVTGTSLGNRGFLIAFGPAFTVVGLLFLWVGRHEWNELHRRRVRHAHLAFLASIVFLLLAVVPLAWAVLQSSTTLPDWAHWLFTFGIAGTFFLTFLTYALVVFHLIGRPAKVVVLFGLAWSAGVALLIGLALDSHLAGIVGAILKRSLAFGTLLSPISVLEAYLVVTYLILLGAFLHAHRRVAQGAPTDDPPPEDGTPS